MKIYNIVHVYESEEDFGGSHAERETIASTTEKAKAEAYVKKWSKEEQYARTCVTTLWHHKLEIEIQNIEEFDLDKNPFDYEKESTPWYLSYVGISVDEETGEYKDYKGRPWNPEGSYGVDDDDDED